MIAPNSGFRREANAHQTSLSTLQKVVRYAEKDDLLLYITAAFGVLMPAIMYFFYRYVHNRYQQNKKVLKMCKKRKEYSRSVTIFYCSDVPTTKEIAYELAENLNFDPLVAKLGAKELENARNQKALHIFVLSNINNIGEMSIIFTEFINLLDEIKYERRDKIYLRGVKFAILYAELRNDEHNLEDSDCKTVLSLEKRLKSLEGIPLCQPQKIDLSNNKKSMPELLLKLNDLLRRFNYGEFDAPDLTESEEYSTEEDSE